MTIQAQVQGIAARLGWEYAAGNIFPSSGDSYVLQVGRAAELLYFCRLVEAALSYEQRLAYGMALHKIIHTKRLPDENGEWIFNIANASAEQKLAALVQALGGPHEPA